MMWAKITSIRSNRWKISAKSHRRLNLHRHRNRRQRRHQNRHLNQHLQQNQHQHQHRNRHLQQSLRQHREHNTFQSREKNHGSVFLICIIRCFFNDDVSLMSVTAIVKSLFLFFFLFILFSSIFSFSFQVKFFNFIIIFSFLCPSFKIKFSLYKKIIRNYAEDKGEKKDRIAKQKMKAITT